MRFLLHLIFWLVITAVLVLIFGKVNYNFTEAFYFVTFLLPVGMATSYFINYYLIPKYLIKRSFFKFILYFIYTLIISLHLELMVITAAFIGLANYKYQHLNPYFGNVFLLTWTIYFIVFLMGFIQLLRKYHQNEQQISELKDQHLRNQTAQIVIRADRKNIPVAIYNILYIESLADYVKIHTQVETMITKEKISELEKKLPDTFIRIHRSYLINQDKVSSFTKEQVMIAENPLPLSRTYKKEALTKLEVITSLTM